MHILFLSDNFPPEVNAPAARTWEHCREWVQAGHQVTVITCAPNFPQGKVYNGYRNRLRHCETIDGIRVVRVWSFISANEGFLKRTLDYASFLPSAFAAALLEPKPQVVVGTSPQFFTVCAAWLTSLAKGAPFVFELRDIWPESIKAVGAMKDSPVLRWLERIERLLYRKATRIVAVTESYKRILARRGVDPAKIAVVTNGVDLTRFRPREKDPELVARYGLEGQFVAGYVGTHGLAHGLETLLEAADLVRTNGRGDSIRFVLLGNGARKQALCEMAARMGLENVSFIDSVPKDQVTRYWSLLDVSIIHLKRSELFTAVIPSKLFEGMGMGIPVLHGVRGESARIVEREGLGLVFEPENARDLCEKLIRLREDPERHGEFKANCLAAAPRYDRTRLAADLLKILEEIGRG